MIELKNIEKSYRDGELDANCCYCERNRAALPSHAAF